MKPCRYTQSGCNYPEGDCPGTCMPVKMHEVPPDFVPGECNEIPAPTIPIGGWGWLFPLRRVQPKK